MNTLVGCRARVPCKSEMPALIGNFSSHCRMATGVKMFVPDVLDALEERGHSCTYGECRLHACMQQ